MSYGPWVEVEIVSINTNPTFSPYDYYIRRTDTGRYLGFSKRETLLAAPPEGAKTERKWRLV